MTPANPNTQSAPKRKLPLGIQNFREIREGDCYYVDKTEHVRRLVEGGKYFFLSRPPPLRQEPSGGYVEGTLRGQRILVPRAAHLSALGLVGTASGPAARLQRWFQDSRRAPCEPDGSIRRHRGTSRPHGRLGFGIRSLPPADPSAASQDRPARGGAGRRIRQANPRRIAYIGGRQRKPSLGSSQP